MADEAETPEPGIEVVTEPSVVEAHTVVVGTKSQGSVEETQKEAFEHMDAKLRNLDKPRKPAKPEYKPFKW